MIRVSHITKSFGGVKAVSDCNLAIEEGKITSIIGPNGAGKTTLFNIICGVIDADSGSVLYDDKELRSGPHHVARAGVSRTFQQARLFRNLSVKDNLLLAKQCTDDEIRLALASVHFPLSMEVKASALSYGQSRLVEVARALLRPHKLLMLDEPTAGINPAVRGELRKILLDLKRRGQTVLLIEHDMEFVMSISDHVIVMCEGTVLMEGTPKQVQKDKRVLEAYLGKS